MPSGIAETHVSFKLIGDQVNQLQCQLLRAFSGNTDCLNELNELNEAIFK